MNSHFQKECDTFVKSLLPTLQDLRSLYNAEFSDVNEDCVQKVTLQRDEDGLLGMELAPGHDGFITVRCVVPGVR